MLQYSGEAVDIGRATFVTVLNAISNMFFSIDLGGYSSNLSQEFHDLICVITEEAGKPNVADYFPTLRLVDPQGARRRMMIAYGKLIEIFDRIINERVQLRASSEGSKASNDDVLGSFLNLVEEDNSEISCNDFKHLLLVIDYLSYL